MKEHLRKLLLILQKYYYQRNYYLAKLFPPEVPLRPLSFLPDGFTVNQIGNSGVRVIERFCSEAGASYLMARADELASSGDHSAIVFRAANQDNILLPLFYRASMLTGLDFNHSGPLQAGLVADLGPVDEFPEPMLRGVADTRFAFMTFLSGAGAVEFPDLGVTVQAAVGRAICWEPGLRIKLNYPSDVADDARFWVARFVMSGERVFHPNSVPELIPQTQKGVALEGTEVIPEGAFLTDGVKQQ